MRLPTYRSSHGLRHHPYPQSKRTLARNTFVVGLSVFSGIPFCNICLQKPVDRYDEVSTRAQALELVRLRFFCKQRVHDLLLILFSVGCAAA
jgi:hypothetical protein